MKKKIAAIICIVLLLISGLIGYMRYFNYGIFQGRSVVGLPDNHMQILDTSSGHFDLLFDMHTYGGIAFNIHTSDISVYIAHYEHGKRVSQKLVKNISMLEPAELNGHLHWGITTHEGQRQELRTSLSAGGVSSSGFFDFTQVDFQHAAILGTPLELNGMIERDRIYPLFIRQSSGLVRHVDINDSTDIEILANENELFTILYIIFR